MSISQSLASGRPHGKSPASTVEAAPASKVDLASMCLLSEAPGCATSVGGVSLVPSAPASDPVSSWTNITPTSGSKPQWVTIRPAESYYPAGHEDILFGGLAAPNDTVDLVETQNTWAFANNHWVELISNTSCTPTTCPSPRQGAMLTYYPPDNGLILFGGENYSYSTDQYYSHNDTWLFANNTWTNITAQVGAAPSPRSMGAMIWDQVDDLILLFGGNNYLGASTQDIWFFYEGQWLNFSGFYTASTEPSPRAGEAVAESPTGYIMIYGGEDNGAILENGCGGADAESIAWWFYSLAWTVEGGWSGYCPPPEPGAAAPSAAASPTPPPGADPVSPFWPCGELSPALGWSIKNDRFALYGGLGPNYSPNVEGDTCDGPTILSNQTYLYGNQPGGDFYWYNVSDSGDPTNRSGMGYVTDYTDNYFLIFGGRGENAFGDIVDFNATYRFYAIVHARMSGPSGIPTTGEFFRTPISIFAYGGSGDLNYKFSITPIRNSNTLSGTNCGEFTSGANYTVPYNGTLNIYCAPTEGSYNVYRLTLNVSDALNHSDYALANLVFTVIPPETAVINSEYATYFYTGVSFENTFTLDAVVAGGSARTIDATIGGTPVTFQQESNPDLWDFTTDMANVAPGTIIKAQANFAGWTLNATFDVAMISTPVWLATLFDLSSNQTITSHGAGPYNKTYTITEDYNWNIGQALGFDLPIPLVSGDYSLIPSLKVTFTADSMGDIAIHGNLALNPPAINFGAFSLSISASFNLTGTFGLNTVGSDVTSIQWLSAEATVSVSGDFSGSVPLYGFSILGVTIGFVLDVSINPSITLGMILAPTSNPSQELISGIGVKIQSFFGSFTLPLSVSVNFGIGIASVGIGGTISVALNFIINPNIDIGAGWVNGSIFVQAQFMFWSDSWNLVSGTIYHWDPPAAVPGPLGLAVIPYNETGTWTVNPRYYVGPQYDRDVWSPSATEGAAISDVYPYTEVAGAAGYNGGYLFYSDDNASQPADHGLEISGLRLDPATNALDQVPSPVDPGFIIANPRATTLSDGNLYVVWAAIPSSELGDASPLDLSAIDLQGAEFYPATQSWGSIHTFSSWGFPQSYQVNATGSSADVVALMASVPLIGDTTPEKMVEYSVASGSVIGNVSISQVSEVTGFRASSSLAVVLDFSTNYSTVNLATGNQAILPYTPPAGYALLSAGFVAGSDSALVALYRGNKTAEIVLYDLATDQLIANLTVAGDTSAAAAVANGGQYYVVASTVKGIETWTESGGAFANVSTVAQTGIESLGVVQAGSSLLVYSVATTGGNDSAPIRSLVLVEVSAALPAVPGGPSAATTSSGPSSTDYLLYLAIAIVVEAVILAVIAIRGRRPPQQITATPMPSGVSEGPPPAGPTG